MTNCWPVGKTEYHEKDDAPDVYARPALQNHRPQNQAELQRGGPGTLRLDQAERPQKKVGKQKVAVPPGVSSTQVSSDVTIDVKDQYEKRKREEPKV